MASKPKLSEAAKAWLPMHRAASTVLQAGICLTREHGLGRLALLPYFSETGYWRCEFHVQGWPSRTLFRYSSDAQFEYLSDFSGGRSRKSWGGEDLAWAILASLPQALRHQCEGDLSPDMRAWQDELLKGLKLPNGADPCLALPAAWYAESDRQDDGWYWHALVNGPGLPMAAAPGFVPPNAEPPLSDDPFWQPRLAAWAEHELKPGAALPVYFVDRHGVLDDIAKRLWLDANSVGEDHAVELFQMAIRSALAALQPQPMDAVELLVMARAVGLAPCLVDRRGEWFVEFRLADEEQGADDPAEQDRDLNRRLVQMLQLVGRVPDEATRKELQAMQTGSLVACMLADRQQVKLAAQKLAAKTIRRAGKQSARRSSMASVQLTRAVSSSR